MPPLLDWRAIAARLEAIFPPGVEHRSYVVREMAARTIFTMLYAGAVEGTGVWVRPGQVTRMSDVQAAAVDDDARAAWARVALRPGYRAVGDRWYADNTREPIRDETLRHGLVPLGAVIERTGVPPTSSRPRYALARGFALLFDPGLDAAELERAAAAWRQTALDPRALLRLGLRRGGLGPAADELTVRFPNGEGRRLDPGPSSFLVKAVIERFAPAFLAEPAVVWLSQSADKTSARDRDLARRLHLTIDPTRHLPDVILVDLGAAPPLLVFVEAVATGGEIDRSRRDALLATVAGSAFTARDVAFVTAFIDRGEAVFRRVAGALAWNSFAWFAAEPEALLVYRGGPTGSQPAGALLRTLVDGL